MSLLIFFFFTLIDFFFDFYFISTIEFIFSIDLTIFFDLFNKSILYSGTINLSF